MVDCINGNVTDGTARGVPEVHRGEASDGIDAGQPSCHHHQQQQRVNTAAISVRTRRRRRRKSYPTR